MDNKELLQEEIGKRIKALREQKNISQRDLAYACGIEPANLARLESGGTNPTLFTLHKLAQNLNISITELLNVHPFNQ